MKQHARKSLTTLLSSVKGAHFLIAAAMTANICNFFFSTYLGRSIGFAEFGLISLIGSFLNIAQIPLSSYSKTVVYKTAYLLGKHNVPASWYWKKLRGNVIRPSLVLTGLWLILTPFLAWYFQASTIVPFLLFTPIWAIGVAGAVDSGFLTGSHAFTAVAIMTVTEAVVRLVSMIVIVQLGYTQFVYAAFPLAAASSFLLGWIFSRRIHKKTANVHEEDTADIPKRFFASTMLIKLSSIAILSFDVVLAKHYLSPADAGKYAMLSLIGNMIYFLGSLVSQFVVPFVGRDRGAGKKSEGAFLTILLFTIVMDVIGWMGVGVFGFITVPFLFGQRAVAIVPYLPLYTFAMAAFSVGNTIVAYHQVKEHHRYSLISILTAVGVIGGVTLFHDSIYQINAVMCVNAGVFLLTVLFFFRFEERLRPIFHNVEALIRLFTDVYQRPRSTERLSILVLNWRDTRHVWAGGAENYIHELSKQWVRDGHKVTVFCGNDQKSPRNEVIDGVQMVRRGGFYTVYIWAFLYYILRFRGNVDVVIDSENGIPFFSPLYARVPVFLLIHHVHQEVLRQHLMFPLSHIGMFLESSVMPWVYKTAEIITVSDSSKKDIMALGFSNAKRIHVIHPGIDNKKFRKNEKTDHPSLLYLGRLKAYKDVDIALRAFHTLQKTYNTAIFTIAGEGPSAAMLKELTVSLNLQKNVNFVGKVSDEEKIRLMGSHWVMVQPSSIEGFGITVIESNACFTPVVASDVAGLRDSVQHKKTGLLFKAKDSEDLTRKLTELFSNSAYRYSLGKSAWEWSKSFDWKEGATHFLQIILFHMDSRTGQKPARNELTYQQSTV